MNHKAPIKKTYTPVEELIEMQTEFALVDSMRQSKTLTIMVVLSVISFAAFIYFLFNIAS
ncbi:MAG: hypothetical protein BM565_03545 [Gammaproteobacteria bacterium MedPE]|nr:MAG: hypothetical protein BM565_03545 [Gammaproteobacteria bacterium MedPE]